MYIEVDNISSCNCSLSATLEDKNSVVRIVGSNITVADKADGAQGSQSNDNKDDEVCTNCGAKMNK